MTKGAKPDTWMPLFIGDYLKDTGRLSTEQHGAYILLIMDYWTNGPPADDDDELSAITRLDLKTWRRHRPKLERFFRVEDGHLRHKRIDEELAAAQGKSDKAAEKASAAARARWDRERPKQPDPDAPSTPPSSARSDAQAHARSMLEECPSPSPSAEYSEPDGSVSASADAVRKAHLDEMWRKAPNRGRERSSRKDLERAVRAAVKRGHTIEQIAAGVVAYYASDQATKDGGEFAKGIHRLVENDRWQEFTPAGSLFHGDMHVERDDPMLRPSEVRQRLWMQDFQASPGQWREHERGPKPGAVGCRVSPEIQREFGIEPALPQVVKGAA